MSDSEISSQEESTESISKKELDERGLLDKIESLNRNERVNTKTKVIVISVIFLILIIFDISFTLLLSSENQVDLIEKLIKKEAVEKSLPLITKLEQHYQSKENRRITQHDEILVLSTLKENNITHYKVFRTIPRTEMVSSKGFTGRELIITSATYKLINQSKYNKNVYNENFTLDKKIGSNFLDLYIPVYNQNIVILARIRMIDVKESNAHLITNMVLISTIIILLHILFGIAAFWLIIRPLEAINTSLGQSYKDLYDTNYVLIEELQIAGKIQRSILPPEPPELKNFNFHYTYIPMESVSGDFLDFFHLPDGRMSVVLLDVSGHGVPAALITTMAKVSFTNHTKLKVTTGEICRLVNEDLIRSDLHKTGYYFTAFLMIINPKTNEIEFTNCGHPTPYIYYNHEKKIGQLCTQEMISPPIGLTGGLTYVTHKFVIDKGDKLLVYTDGLVEAMNPRREMYEDDKLIHYFNTHLDASLDDFGNGLIADIDAFYAGEAPNDDRSFWFIEALAPAKIKAKQRVSEIKPSFQETLDKNKRIGQGDELDGVEEIQEISDVDDIVEVDEVEEVEEIDELEELHELDGVPELTELDDVEPLDEFDEIEEASEIEDVEELTELDDDIDIVEEIEEAREYSGSAQFEDYEVLSPVVPKSKHLTPTKDEIDDLFDGAEQLESIDHQKVEEEIPS